MAISTTEILGNDGISESRLVINDNFKTLTNEINLMENYFDPSNGIIDQLNTLSTDNLTVGLSSSTVLNITQSSFDIISDVNINGNILLNGKIIKNTIESDTLDDTLGYTHDIGSSTTNPSKTIYRVSNSSNSSSLIINLFEGLAGQEVIFVYEGGNTGPVNIIQAGASAAPIILPGGYTTIEITEGGHSIKLLSVTNSVGNNEWYLVGGYGYTLA